jgi:hypothetical protein
MRHFLIALLFPVISLTTACGQKTATNTSSGNHYPEPDTSKLHIVFTVKDSTSGYLENTTSWFADDGNKLILVRHSFGNHLGRVSGHRNTVNYYYFFNDTLRKATVVTKNFDQEVSRRTLMFGDTTRNKGVSKKLLRFYKKQGEYLRKKFSKFQNKSG